MTLGEINDRIEAENQKIKQQTIYNYNLASMIAQFVGCSFAGKKIPSLQELYPDYTDEHLEKQQVAFMVEQFRDFANKHNSLRQGG